MDGNSQFSQKGENVIIKIHTLCEVHLVKDRLGDIRPAKDLDRSCVTSCRSINDVQPEHQKVIQMMLDESLKVMHTGDIVYCIQN